MDKIRIKISKLGYNQKPTIEDMKAISWFMKSDSSINDMTFKDLSNVLEDGYSVLLADYYEHIEGIEESKIKSLSCIALDIDSKEKKTHLYKMVSDIYKKLGIYPIIHYCTFSDEDGTKFRLIYRLEDKIDVETYRALYKALQWKFKQLDTATCNANRIWAGTNKGVTYIQNNIPLSFQAISKLVKAHQRKLKKKEEQIKIIKKENYKNIEQDSYIKTEHKKEVLELLTQNIDLRDFIPKHFGGKYKNINGNLTGCCIFHGGDNKTALVISKEIYTCFTHCGTGNIITAARKAYNEENFSKVAFELAKEYNLHIPCEYIKEMN